MSTTRPPEQEKKDEGSETNYATNTDQAQYEAIFREIQENLVIAQKLEAKTKELEVEVKQTDALTHQLEERAKEVEAELKREATPTPNNEVAAALTHQLKNRKEWESLLLGSSPKEQFTARDPVYTSVAEQQDFTEVRLEGDSPFPSPKEPRQMRERKAALSYQAGGYPPKKPITFRIFSEGEALIPKEENPFHFSQKFLQHLLKFIGSAAPAYLIGPFLPWQTEPYASMVETAGFAVNSNIGDILNALTTKEDPTSGLRARGNGSVMIGLLSSLSPEMFSLALLLSIGYGVGEAAQIYSESLMNSDNSFAQGVGLVLNTPEIRGPILGIFGYVTNETIKYLGMKIWNTCSSSKEEEFNPDPHINILQSAGGYAVRWFEDVAITEMILFPVQMTHPLGHGAQLGILIGVDAFRKISGYFAYTPHPWDRLCAGTQERVPNDNPSIEQIEEANNNTPEVHRTSEYDLMGLLQHPLSTSLLTIGAYGLSWVIQNVLAAECAVNNINKELCDSQNQQSRLMYSSALAAGLTGIFVAKEVLPRVTRCVSTLFSRPQSAPPVGVPPEAINALMKDSDEVTSSTQSTTNSQEYTSPSPSRTRR